MSPKNSDSHLKKLLEERTATESSGVPRYKVRREQFGSLIYDFEIEDYMAFDLTATILFDESRTIEAEKVFENILASQMSYTSFHTFLKLCQSLDLIGPDGKFKGEFIDQLYFPKDNTHLSAPTTLKISISDKLDSIPKFDEMAEFYSRKGKLKPLSIDAWGKLIDEMVDMGTYKLHVLLDPLQSKLFPYILERAFKRKIKVIITTTASSLSNSLNYVSKEGAERVKEIRVRIDGVSEKTYQITMGKPHLNRVMRNLGKIKDIFRDATILMEVYLTLYNVSELPSFIRFGENNGFQGIIFKFPLTGEIDQLIPPKEIMSIVEALRRQQENTFLTIDLLALPNPFNEKLIYEGFGCPCGRQWMFVAPNGEIYPGPCFSSSEDFLAGRYPEVSLLEAWRSSEPFRRLREIESFDERCKTCEYFSTCRGGCRYRALKLKGKLTSRDPMCPLFPDV